MITQFKTSDGEIIEYQYNKFGKQTIIFLPALGFDYTYWGKTVSYFNQRDYSTLVVTLRGHTKLKTALKEITMQHHINDLHGVVSYVKIKKPILVGASLGGSITASYFQTYREEVEKCICINTPFSINDIRPYIKWFVVLCKPLVFFDIFTRKRTYDFSKSRFTHNIVLGLHYARQFHLFGFYLNYLCVKTMGQLSRDGIIVIDSTRDEVIKKRKGANYVIPGNHAVVISKPSEVNQLIEKIISEEK